MLLPAKGARIGETLITSIMRDSTLTASAPRNTSRTMARAMTMPLQAPSPWKNRMRIRVWMLGAKAQPMQARQYRAMPANRGGLRPNMSAAGP